MNSVHYPIIRVYYTTDYYYEIIIIFVSCLSRSIIIILLHGSCFLKDRVFLHGLCFLRYSDQIDCWVVQAWWAQRNNHDTS